MAPGPSSRRKNLVETFSIVTVCTGNICRSPLAESLMRARLQARLGKSAQMIHISSAGTGALVGHPMDEDAAAALAGFGCGADQHRGRALDQAVVAGADLVLTATRDHRAATVRLLPRATRKTFTLREFSRLAAAVPPEALPLNEHAGLRLRAAVAAAAALRGMLPPDPGGDDIEDPYRRSRELHVGVAARIGAALEAPVDLLAAAVQGGLRSTSAGAALQ